tara:strand:+ start:7378 stop:7914 length:537 start_codon:yes stop_codon:yes gene_type:complete
VSWHNILKNQITQGKQGILTADSPLPKKKNSRKDCKKEISRWFANHVNIKDKFDIDDSVPNIGRGMSLSRWEKLPESTACKILDWFKEEFDIITNSGGRTRSNSIDGYICFVSVPSVYTHIKKGELIKFFKMRAEIKTDKWEQVISIEISAGMDKFNEYGDAYATLGEWGRNNLDFRK